MNEAAAAGAPARHAGEARAAEAAQQRRAHAAEQVHGPPGVDKGRTDAG